MRPVIVLLLFAAIVSAQEYVPGRLLARPATGVSRGVAEATIANNGGIIERELPRIGVLVIQVSEQAREQVAEALRQSGRFDFVEVDVIGHGAVIPNDPSYPNQWHLPKVSAPQAWDTTTGSASVLIGVVDSGCNGAHVDLAAKCIAGWSFLTDTAVPAGAQSDTGALTGHGTAVSGTAAASTNNGIGVAGVAWQSPIVPLVVLDASDFASWSDVAQAATWAADHGIKVLNISLEGNSDSSTLESGLQYAKQHGVTIVACAGNNSSSVCMYPGCSPHVISVGATTSSDTLASFSNYGYPHLYAPGTSIYTTAMSGGYGAWQGTSFSSPIVAGAVALALTLDPTLTPDGIKTLLQSTADTVAPGLRLNIAQLVSQLAGCSATLDSVSVPCSASVQ